MKSLISNIFHGITENGIQFRISSRFIDNTREMINELVGSRIEVTDSEREIFNRKKPDNSFYIKDMYYDVLDGVKGKQWEQCQNVALDLKTGLKRWDRQSFLVQEEMVIEYDLALLGKEEFDEEKWKKTIEGITGKECKSINWNRKPELSHEGLIREIIIRFENNVTGISNEFEINPNISKLKRMYFTSEKRKNVINSLMEIINREKGTEQYYRDLELIEQIIEEEKSKECTVGMLSEKKYQMPKIYDELFKRIEEELIRAGRKDRFIDVDFGANKDLKNLLYYLFDSKLYEKNKTHSTDHIAKVVIFLYILTQKEKLSHRESIIACISGLLHDNERNDENGDESHGELGAKNAKRILEENVFPFNELDLTEEEIKRIQIAIECHDKIERNSRYNNHNGWNLWIQY